MRRVYLAQINTSFGDNAFLPYSAGLLWAWAAKDDRISSSYELGGLLCRRSDLSESVAAVVDPDVLALSCYVWNWRYSMELARAVKDRYPGCMVVLGGPEVPNASTGFMESHPHVDVLVHGEGEEAFGEILLSRLGVSDLSGVRGISLRASDGSTARTPDRKRMSDIDVIPSPYVSGVFDGLMEGNPGMNWHASQETHRGCPYSCTFCDWGSAVYTKVREFGTDRLIAEMDWFSQRRIDLLYNCDANYGMLKRDTELTRQLIHRKSLTGYPRKFRASYAKKSDRKVYEISGMLADAGMSKGVTLSLQSLNDATLSAVKRGNISMGNFGELVNLYRDSGIPTYTEMIIGLPGETEQSFRHGLETVLGAGQHDSINVYPCMVLRNSEMGDPRYIAEHGITSVTIPIGGNHGTPDPSGITEYQDVVVSTNTMDAAAWRRSYAMSWMVQALHCLGPTQLLAMQHRCTHGSHMGFYELLLDSFAGTDTVLGREMAWLEYMLDGIASGSNGFDRCIPGFGDVMWTPEEGTFLVIAADLDGFYDELRPVLGGLWPSDLCDDLLAFQRNMVLDPHRSADGIVRTRHDMLSFHASALRGDATGPRASACITRFTSNRYFRGDTVSYAREVVWYGRKQALHRMRAERIETDDIHAEEIHAELAEQAQVQEAPGGDAQA